MTALLAQNGVKHLLDLSNMQPNEYQKSAIQIVETTLPQGL